jgi:SOS-response transcriptional repressor LexA
METKPLLVIRERLAAYMEALGVSANELARRSGIPQSTISRILNGTTENPETGTVLPLVDALNVPTRDFFNPNVTVSALTFARQRDGSYQLEQNVEPLQGQRRTVPLISWVKAGSWSEIVDAFQPGDADQWVPAPMNASERTFALRVLGVSMEPEFHEGDVIIVDPDAAAEHRKFVVVRLDHREEATFKQLIVEDGRRYLKALNPAWPEPYIEVTQDATICGVVVSATRTKHY